jgi:hypothetical protein
MDYLKSLVHKEEKKIIMSLSADMKKKTPKDRAKEVLLRGYHGMTHHGWEKKPENAEEVSRKLNSGIEHFFLFLRSILIDSIYSQRIKKSS